MNESEQQPRILFCPRCGHAEVKTISSREFQCDSCGFRHFINPLPAVAGIVTNSTGEILLVQRAREPGRGLFCLPGGFVDPGETAEEALSREVFEETDLRVDVDQWRYFVSFPNQYLFQEVLNPVLDLFYTAAVPSLAGARAREEVLAVTAVFPFALELDRIAFPSVRRALRLYRSGLASGTRGRP